MVDKIFLKGEKENPPTSCMYYNKTNSTLKIIRPQQKKKTKFMLENKKSSRKSLQPTPFRL